jgi:hypothetical protein
MTAEHRKGERGRNYLSLSEETLLDKAISAINLYSVLAVLQDTNITNVIVGVFLNVTRLLDFSLWCQSVSVYG